MKMLFHLFHLSLDILMRYGLLHLKELIVLINSLTRKIISIAKLLISSVKRLDHLFGKPMPYTMAVHFPPRGYENNFHHYISFQPMRRDTNKLKFLAGIEQITGLMLSDILPEDAAFS